MPGRRSRATPARGRLWLAAGIRAAVQATAGNAVVVEDHWAEGGLGDAVLEALAGEEPVVARVVHLAVREMPGSGTCRSSPPMSS